MRRSGRRERSLHHFLDNPISSAHPATRDLALPGSLLDCLPGTVNEKLSSSQPHRQLPWEQVLSQLSSPPSLCTCTRVWACIHTLTYMQVPHPLSSSVVSLESGFSFCRLFLDMLPGSLDLQQPRRCHVCGARSRQPGSPAPTQPGHLEWHCRRTSLSIRWRCGPIAALSLPCL